MNMTFELFAIAAAASFLVGCVGLLALWAPSRATAHRAGGDGEPMAGLDAVEGAVFALLGLLLAFAISGALQRFDERRQLTVQEGIAIGTAYDHLDLLAPEPRDALKGKLKAYLAARIGAFPRGQSTSTSRMNARSISEAEEAKIAALKAELWSGTLSACPSARYVSTCSVFCRSSAVFSRPHNCATARTKNIRPKSSSPCSTASVSVGSLLAGFSMAASNSPSRVHLVAFALALSFALFVLTNVEFPRLGLIRVDYFDHFLTETYSRLQ